MGVNENTSEDDQTTRVGKAGKRIGGKPPRGRVGHAARDEEERKEAAKLILELALTVYVFGSLLYKSLSAGIFGDGTGVIPAAHKSLMITDAVDWLVSLALWLIVIFGYLRVYFGTHFVDYDEAFVRNLNMEPQDTRRREVVLRFFLYFSSLSFVGAIDKPYLVVSIFFGLVQIATILGYIFVMRGVLFAKGVSKESSFIVIADILYSVTLFSMFCAAGGLIGGQIIALFLFAFVFFFLLIFALETYFFYGKAIRRSIFEVCHYVNGERSRSSS